MIFLNVVFHILSTLGCKRAVESSKSLAVLGYNIVKLSAIYYSGR